MEPVPLRPVALLAAALLAACAPTPAPGRFADAVRAFRGGDAAGVVASLTDQADGSQPLAPEARLRIVMLSMAASRSPPLSPEARLLYAERLCAGSDWADFLLWATRAQATVRAEPDGDCRSSAPILSQWRRELSAAADFDDRMLLASRALDARGLTARAPWSGARFGADGALHTEAF